MATTQTSNLNVTITNQYGDKKTLRVPNPMSNVTTVAQVADAFADLLSTDTNLFMAGTVPYTAVRSARKVVTTQDELS